MQYIRSCFVHTETNGQQLLELYPVWKEKGTDFHNCGCIHCQLWKSANSWWQMIQLIWACIKCYLQELDKDQDAGVCNIVTHHLNHPLGDNHIAPSRNKGSVACFFFHLLILRCLLKKSEHLLCCWYTFGILEAMWKVFWLIFKVDVFNYEDILDFLHFGYSKLNWV